MIHNTSAARLLSSHAPWHGLAFLLLLLTLAGMPAAAQQRPGGPACDADARRFCGEYPRGGARVMECLAANAARVSGTCRAAISRSFQPPKPSFPTGTEPLVRPQQPPKNQNGGVSSAQPPKQGGKNGGKNGGQSGSSQPGAGKQGGGKQGGGHASGGSSSGSQGSGNKTKTGKKPKKPDGQVQSPKPE